MYNKELENLINIALEDGVLTDKEKQVLSKKAEALGVDLDEFEMVLDARLAKQNKSDKAAVSYGHEKQKHVSWEYKEGVEARKNFLSALKYIIVAGILLAIEIIYTSWWALLLGPITIIVIIIIARNSNTIRGFLGLEEKEEN